MSRNFSKIPKNIFLSAFKHTLAICAILAIILALWGWSGVRAQGGNQAGLVVQYGDGSITTHCVAFSENQISGQQLLERSGLDIELAASSGMGTAVCRIGPDGCPASNCFCQSPPDYWSYWHLTNDDWVYSQVGVSGWTITPGAVDGWSWGPGNPPPVISFDEICVPPTATSTDTSTPTEILSSTLTAVPDTTTPQPTASSTPAPSATDEHAPTATVHPSETSEQRLSDTPIPTATTSPSPTPSNTPSPLPGDTQLPSQTATQPGMDEDSAIASLTTATPAPLPSQDTPSPTAFDPLDTVSNSSTAFDRSKLMRVLSYGVFCLFVILLVGGIVLTYLLFRKNE